MGAGRHLPVPAFLPIMESMKRLQQTYHIKAPVARVWEALVDPEAIGAWGGGPAKMAARAGRAVRAVGRRHPRRQHRGRKGKGAGAGLVFRRLELSLPWSHSGSSLKQGGTRVVLVHRNIPDAELADIRDGWREYYLGPMKAWLER